MRRLIALPVLVLTLTAFGCSGMPSGSFLDQIIWAATQKCGFVPSIEALLKLLGQHSNWTNALDIANKLCSLVPPPPHQFGAHPSPVPMYENIPVDGEYVR